LTSWGHAPELILQVPKFYLLRIDLILFAATANLLHWSKQEENNLLSHIFGRVAELNWMWKKAIDEFNIQV